VTSCALRLVPTSLGVFNGHSPLFGGTTRNLITWNARALICCDKAIQQKKFTIIRKFLDRAAIVCLQEVHGTVPELEKMLNKLKDTHVIHHSLFPDRAAGGVCYFTASRRLSLWSHFFSPASLGDWPSVGLPNYFR